MKKLTILTTMALLGLSISLSAQEMPAAKKNYAISKGTKLMIANISGNYSKPNFGYGSGNISIGEQSGYFVIDNLSVGINMSYSFSYNKSNMGLAPSGANIYLKSYRHHITPGVFLRYYKMFTPKFGLLGQFQALYLMGFINNQSNDAVYAGKDRTMGVDINITPRLVYFATPKLAVEGGFGSIGYNYQRDNNSGLTSHSAGFSVNPSLSLGLSLYFGKGVIVKD